MMLALQANWICPICDEFDVSLVYDRSTVEAHVVACHVMHILDEPMDKHFNGQ